MIDNASAGPMGFATPVDSLESIDAATAAALVVAASDVALVIDEKGVVRDAAFGNRDLATDGFRGWVGRRWVDTVTVESRPKIEELIRDATPERVSRWRQVNYPDTAGGPDIPIRFTVIRFGANRRLVAIGRDLRAMADLQKRLVQAQQDMEREYERIRSADKRYRLLFQMAAEAVMIVDAASLKIVEANPAAGILMGREPRKLVGHVFGDLFDEPSRQAHQSFVAALSVTPRVDHVHVTPVGGRESLLLSGSLFRQETAPYLLVLLSRLGTGGGPLAAEKADLLRTVEKIPEAFVVTDHDGRVLSGNAAFVDLVQAGTIEQVRGEPLDRWFGRGGVDIDLLFTNLRNHGVVRRFSTVVRGQFGSSGDVEMTGVDVAGGLQPCFGFTIRPGGTRLLEENRMGGRELPRTVEQFAGLVGRVPLKNLVRETTDLIERLCIEAALELTRDNKASAADVLGLSRQGLYAKLRRYGLGNLDTDEHSSPDDV